MKYILTLAAAVFFAATAQAQLQTLYADGTVPVVVSNVPNALIDAKYAKDVSLQVQFKLHSAGTSGVAFVLDSSNDNVNWKTGTQNFWLAANGTTAVGTNINYAVNGLPYLRLAYVHNTNNAVVTNLIVTAFTKRGI